MRYFKDIVDKRKLKFKRKKICIICGNIYERERKFGKMCQECILRRRKERNYSNRTQGMITTFKVCNFCDFTGNTDNVVNHILRCHNEEVYNVDMDIKTRRRSKNYSCKFCDFYTEYSAEFRKHIKEHKTKLFKVYIDIEKKVKFIRNKNLEKEI